jgi:hypothetical protein
MVRRAARILDPVARRLAELEEEIEALLATWLSCVRPQLSRKPKAKRRLSVITPFRIRGTGVLCDIRSQPN